MKGLETAGDSVTGLRTRSGMIPVGTDDAVVSAVPPFSVGKLLPELTPEGLETRAIVNVHYLLPEPVPLRRRVSWD